MAENIRGRGRQPSGDWMGWAEWGGVGGIVMMRHDRRSGMLDSFVQTHLTSSNLSSSADSQFDAVEV